MNIKDFYKNYDEGSRLNHSRSRQLELITTNRLISEHFDPKGNLLELGSGHGTYADYWSKHVEKVVATDLVSENVEFMRTRFQNRKNIEVHEVNAIDLSIFKDCYFDTVLNLGPYYHLQNKGDRLLSLTECKRVSRKNGIIAVAYINKYFAHALYVKYGKLFSEQEYKLFTANNYSKLGRIDDFMSFSYFSSPSEVESEIVESGIKIIGNYGVDGPFGLFPESLDKFTDEDYQVFSDFHYSTCHEASTLGMSSHGLFLGINYA